MCWKGRQLPSLAVLNIGENRLPSLSAEVFAALQLAAALPRLRVLVLSETPLTWPEIERLGAAAPALEELHAVRCGLREIAAAPARWDEAGRRVVVGDGSGGGAFVSATAFTALSVSCYGGSAARLAFCA